MTIEQQICAFAKTHYPYQTNWLPQIRARMAEPPGKPRVGLDLYIGAIVNALIEGYYGVLYSQVSSQMRSQMATNLKQSIVSKV